MLYKVKFRKVLSATLIFLLAFGVFSTALASKNTDAANHWAAANLNDWIAKGWLKGYSDHSIRPDQKITRGEFAALVNRAFALNDQAELHFSDLKESDWEYEEIAKAVQAGYMTGYETGKIGSRNLVTRQEVAQMVAKLLNLDLRNDVPLDRFRDQDTIAGWSKNAVAAVVEKEIMIGDSNRTFRPLDSITRAEAIVTISRSLESKSAVVIFDQPGTYGSGTTETINGNVIVSVPGVTLQNMVINGDLLLDEGIGEGDVFLKKITVFGTTTVKGGGANSVHLEDTVTVKIIVDKANGSVRIVAYGATQVEDVLIKSPVKLEQTNVTDSGFKNVEVAKELPAGSNVELLGSFEDVRVKASKVTVSIPKGSVNNLKVEEGADATEINVSKEATILKLVLDIVAQILGEGQVKDAVINEKAAGTTFETKPEQTTGSAKDTVKVNPPSTSTPTSPSTGSESGDEGTYVPPSTPSDPISPSDPSTKSDNAYLKEIQISEPFGTWERLGANQKVEAKDVPFDKNYFMYQTFTSEDFAGAKIEVSLVPEHANAKIRYYVTSDSRTVQTEYNVNQATFELDLKPRTDTRIDIYVSAEDGITQKRYEFAIRHHRTVVDNISLSTTKNGTSRLIQFNNFDQGDIVRIYGSELGQDLLLQHTTPLGTSSKSIELTSVQGEIWISLQKKDQEEGLRYSYSYDFTPIPEITDSTVMIKGLSSRELQDRYPYYTAVFTGFSVSFETALLSQQLSHFEYYQILTTYEHSSNYLQPLSNENARVHPAHYFYERISSKTDRVNYSSASDSKDPRNLHVDVVFYDANKQPIGYLRKMMKLTVDGEQEIDAPQKSYLAYSGTEEPISVTNAVYRINPNMQLVDENDNLILDKNYFVNSGSSPFILKLKATDYLGVPSVHYNTAIVELFLSGVTGQAFAYIESDDGRSGWYNIRNFLSLTSLDLEKLFKNNEEAEIPVYIFAGSITPETQMQLHFTLLNEKRQLFTQSFLDIYVK